jgi:hypothetical protein
VEVVGGHPDEIQNLGDPTDNMILQATAHLADEGCKRIAFMAWGGLENHLKPERQTLEKSILTMETTRWIRCTNHFKLK